MDLGGTASGRRLRLARLAAVGVRAREPDAAYRWRRPLCRRTPRVGPSPSRAGGGALAREGPSKGLPKTTGGAGPRAGGRTEGIAHRRLARVAGEWSPGPGRLPTHGRPPLYGPVDHHPAPARNAQETPSLVSPSPSPSHVNARPFWPGENEEIVDGDGKEISGSRLLPASRGECDDPMQCLRDPISFTSLEQFP